MIPMSPLQKKRLSYVPQKPKILKDIDSLDIESTPIEVVSQDAEKIKKILKQTYGQPLISFKKGKKQKTNPLKVGVVFSGGQASGGHNVIAGLYDALKVLNPNSSLIGFLGGPSGIIQNKTIPIDHKLLENYRNQGGFDMIGSGRTKIETDEQFQQGINTIKAHGLDGLIIIGGDDSNTNTALLAEHFIASGCNTKVIGVPKTIDGDLQNEYIEISFGFDTACKTYSEQIGNIAKDALSAKKYYHFIKLMGRSASHIALECAFATHPNMVIIGEQVAKEKKKLSHIVEDIADLICKRAEKNKNYGVILIPEGLIEFIPEIRTLIHELNKLLAETGPDYGEFKSLQTSQEKIFWILTKLSLASKKCMEQLPRYLQKQLLLDRDPHGNVMVSQIETEKLLIVLVQTELAKRAEKKKYTGKFNAISHFFGYEGRAGLSSNFDATYCYVLGQVAALLVQKGHSGYMGVAKNLTKPVEQWEVLGVPISMMMNMEMRKGVSKAVIKKALVDLEGKPYKHLLSQKEFWELEDHYLCPGPIQFFGDPELTDATPYMLNL